MSFFPCIYDPSDLNFYQNALAGPTVFDSLQIDLSSNIQ